MAAGVYNISIEKGIHFDVSFTLKDSDGVAINVTNFTFKAEVKRRAETSLIKAFTITKTNATNGAISLEMTGANTLALPVGKLAWDLVAKDGSDKIRRYLTGDVTVTESVSNTVFS
jgi:hypothetical protein|tara:strand:- start:435 stop:782 length:348 start_codon:yes stop_codon:yes gene_type:complete